MAFLSPKTTYGNSAYKMANTPYIWQPGNIHLKKITYMNHLAIEAVLVFIRGIYMKNNNNKRWLCAKKCSIEKWDTTQCSIQKLVGLHHLGISNYMNSGVIRQVWENKHYVIMRWKVITLLTHRQNLAHTCRYLTHWYISKSRQKVSKSKISEL